jgi:hypothetical protein
MKWIDRAQGTHLSVGLSQSKLNLAQLEGSHLC